MTSDTLYQPDEELLAPRSNNDLDCHLLSSVRNYVFPTFAATRPNTKVVSYNSSQRTGHTVLKSDRFNKEVKTTKLFLVLAVVSIYWFDTLP
jgi:hypothetical protein